MAVKDSCVVMKRKVLVLRVMMRCGGGKGMCKDDGRSWLSSDDTCERRDEKGH